MTHPDSAPEPSARAAIPLLGLAASLALLTLHQGYLPWRTHPSAVPLAYTLATAPLLCAALLLRRAGELYAWVCALGVAVVFGALAWHQGGMLLPQEPGAAATQSLDWGFFWTQGIALFIALAFLAAQRTHPRRIAYPALYAAAWEHALALAVALVFTGIGWLLLWLWSGLFKVIGIPLFDAVFFDAHFAHPATGLLFGLGLTLGRTQAGMMSALLHVCLAIGAVLLPLIALVGLSFALALPFTGLEGLWSTRRAAALLVALVLGTVALTNAAFQDGAQGGPPYPCWLRGVVNGALLMLPVFGVLALLALTLRVRQYGWTVDRLFGALVIGVAVLYGAGYALAVAWRAGTWLRLAAPVNVGTALVLMLGLLLSHAPWTDFRTRAARSQLAQALRDPAKADIEYLRWQLGQPGVAALRALQADPALAAHPEVHSAISFELAKTSRWGFATPSEQLDLGRQVAVFPRGAQVPDALWRAVRADQDGHATRQVAQCKPTTCAVLAADLDGDGQVEWILLPGPESYVDSPIYAGSDKDWSRVGALARTLSNPQQDWSRILAALSAGRWDTRPARFRELVIGDEQYVVVPSQPLREAAKKGRD